jgi:hypothetical protein
MSTVDDISGPPGRSQSPLGWLHLWFLLIDPVSRWQYAVSGFALMLFKYLVEFLAVGQLTGQLYTFTRRVR